MALYMLIVLNELMDKKYGLTVADRRDFAELDGSTVEQYAEPSTCT